MTSSAPGCCCARAVLSTSSAPSAAWSSSTSSTTSRRGSASAAWYQVRQARRSHGQARAASVSADSSASGSTSGSPMRVSAPAGNARAAAATPALPAAETWTGEGARGSMTRPACGGSCDSSSATWMENIRWVSGRSPRASSGSVKATTAGSPLTSVNSGCGPCGVSATPMSTWLSASR